MKYTKVILFSILVLGVIVLAVYLIARQKNYFQNLTTPATAAQPSEKFKDNIGYVGCSLTVDAINGYYLEGGNQFWQPDKDYNGGTVSRWSSDTTNNNIYWATFQKLYAQKPTKTIWWQICASEFLPADNYDNAAKVLEEIRNRVPGAKIYVSVQPDYTEGYVCPLGGPNAQKIAENIVSQLLDKNKFLKLGPKIGPLSRSQLRDQCHANNEGKRLMGRQLLTFFQS